MNQANPFVQVLESRQLMSVSPLTTAVAADHLKIQADLLQLRADGVKGAIALLADRGAMRADHVGKNATLAPLFKTLRSDAAKWYLTLKLDRLNESTAVIADEKAIVAVQLKMLKDKGNATAMAADRTLLRTDRIRLQEDMIAGLTQRLVDRQAATTQLFADGQAITNALSSPGVSPKMAADVTQWLNDAGTKLTTITTDLQKLLADRTQLATDLTAALNA